VESDGTAAGTFLVKDISLEQRLLPSNLTTLMAYCFSLPTTASMESSYGKRRTAAVYRHGQGHSRGSDDSVPSQPHNVNGTLFFTANDGVMEPNYRRATALPQHRFGGASRSGHRRWCSAILAARWRQTLFHCYR